jgi:choline dehydrogenase-like flavoprotein
MPLDEIDFRGRHWIAHSGWPFGREEFDRWYAEANSLCEAGDYDYEAKTAIAGGMHPTIEGFSPVHFDADGIERFSRPTGFAARYGHRLAKSYGVTVMLGANCTALNTGADGARVDALTVRALSGQQFLIRPAQVVLAMGGLETARLLLASRDMHANGIGNQNDLVGRFYMCHIGGTSGRLRIRPPRRGTFAGYEIAADGTYVRRRYRLKPEAQERHRVGNAILRLHFPRVPDPAHKSSILSGLYLARGLLPFEYRKRLADSSPQPVGRHLRHVLNIARDPLVALRFAGTMLLKRKLAARKFPSIIVPSPEQIFSLDYHGEQEPNPASRVTLSGDRDELGMPRLHVDWRYTAQDIRTAQTVFRLFAADLANQGCGDLAVDDEEIARDMLRDGAYGGHHIGTVRMGVSPRTSVLDAECRVHGMTNLWVAGSAAFPTSGQANPTLTIVALALRLAHRLKALATQPLEVRERSYQPAEGLTLGSTGGRLVSH